MPVIASPPPPKLPCIGTMDKLPSPSLACAIRVAGPRRQAAAFVSVAHCVAAVPLAVAAVPQLALHCASHWCSASVVLWFTFLSQASPA